MLTALKQGTTVYCTRLKNVSGKAFPLISIVSNLTIPSLQVFALICKTSGYICLPERTRLGQWWQRTVSACTERRLQEKRILFENQKRETRETWALNWGCQSLRLALWPECHVVSVPYPARLSSKKQNKLVWSYPWQLLPSGCSWTWSSSRIRI